LRWNVFANLHQLREKARLLFFARGRLRLLNVEMFAGPHDQYILEDIDRQRPDLRPEPFGAEQVSERSS